MPPLLLLLACTGGDTSSLQDSANDTISGATHLVITTKEGIEKRTLDGALETRWVWQEIAEGCDQNCSPEGIQVDGDGLLAAYSAKKGEGGFLRLKAEGGDLVPDWELQDYAFPHDVITDPSGLGVIVAETADSRILWLDPLDGSVHETLDDSHADWSYTLPNGLELIQVNGSAYLLMSNKGNDLSGGSSTAIDGQIVLWDISDPTSPEQVWVYPETGTLGMPHSPVMHKVAGTWVMVYAHSIGVDANDDAGLGSVGVASLPDLVTRPTYLGDGVLPESLGDITHPRGVELSTDGRIYFTETIRQNNQG